MIWIIGNKGMLGRELSQLFEERSVNHVGSDREISILDYGELTRFCGRLQQPPRWIVNCAAYTAVDKAEDDREACFALNADGPERLARLAEECGASFLHLSTDYVFSGESTIPYDEDAPHLPGSVYGHSKSEGEKRAAAVCSRTLILRTAWLYGRYGPNFVYTMLRLMKKGSELGVVHDQRGSPTWAADLAAAVCSIVSSTEPVYGNFHFTNDGICSWYDFAAEIQRLGLHYGLLDTACDIKALPGSAYPTRAKRPTYSVLSKSRISTIYNVILQDWKQSLESFIADLARHPENI